MYPVHLKKKTTSVWAIVWTGHLIGPGYSLKIKRKQQKV